jgi:hypothetical protein
VKVVTGAKEFLFKSMRFRNCCKCFCTSGSVYPWAYEGVSLTLGTRMGYCIAMEKLFGMSLKSRSFWDLTKTTRELKMCLIYCSTRTCQKTVICVFLLDYQFKGLLSHQGIVALNSCWWPNGFVKIFLIHRIILFKPSFENLCFFYLTFTGNVPNKVFLMNVFLLICHK